MKKIEKVFYGSTTVGEKGQIVIPNGARKALQMKKGEKLLVFGVGKGTVILAKLSEIKQLASHLTSRLKVMQTILKTNKK